MFRVMSPFVVNVPTRDLHCIGSLHKAIFSNYGWHISITIAMFVNTKQRYIRARQYNRLIWQTFLGERIECDNFKELITKCCSCFCPCMPNYDQAGSFLGDTHPLITKGKGRGAKFGSVDHQGSSVKCTTTTTTRFCNSTFVTTQETDWHPEHT